MRRCRPDTEYYTMMTQLFTMKLVEDSNIVQARQHAREIAGLLGFEGHDQTRLATAVSEVARSVLSYAGLGKVEFWVEGDEPKLLFRIHVKYSGTKMFQGTNSVGGPKSRPADISSISGVTGLVDEFVEMRTPDGRETAVTLGKWIRRPNATFRLDIAAISAEIKRRIPKDPAEEVIQQNLELMSVLEELRKGQDELTTLNLELKDTNRALKAVTECRKALLRAKNELDLTSEVCRILVEVGGYRMVWVGYAVQDEYKTVRPIACWGQDKGYLESVRITWSNSELFHEPTGTAIRTGKPCQLSCDSNSPGFVPWKNEALQRGWFVAIAVPLFLDGEILGALSLYGDATETFSEEELNLLGQLADDLSFGLMTIRLREAQKRAEQEREALRTQLMQSQKMEALGTLVGGIAHDFNNMLQSILGYSEMLLIGKQKGDLGYDDLQTIIQTARGGADLVMKLLAFGQQAPIFPIPLELNHEIKELITLISRTFAQGIQIDVDFTDGPTTIRADPKQIAQVIMNLAINSSEAMPNGGRLKVATKAVSLDEKYCRSLRGAKPGGFVMLSVNDTGRGMDKETLLKVFDPFFSTKERGSPRGTGLGLSVVKGIVEQQGGHITCESQPGKGTEFRIYFPAIDTPLVALETTVPAAHSGGSETILVVEDTESVVDLEERILGNAGYTVIKSTDGKKALEIYSARRQEISLVILDLIMPEMSGRECLMKLLKIDPSVSVLIASGYSPSDELHDEIRPLVKGFLHKPFGVAQLLITVSSALSANVNPQLPVVSP